MTFRLSVIGRVALVATLTGALVGAVYGGMVRGESLAAMLRGIISGGLIGLFAGLFEPIIGDPDRRARLSRLPIVVSLLLRFVFYVVIILAGLALGALAVPSTIEERFLSITWGDVAFSLLMSFLFNLAVLFTQLLGPRVLLALLTGRYHHPRREERCILFLDMVGSTATGEALGEERFHALLRWFFADLESAVAATGGEIYKFVGDEMIVTWPAAEGVADGRCLEAVRLAARALERRRGEYERTFGVAPRFRAGLHLGTVIAGEIGGFRREIGFVGDTINCAARLVDACRERGEQMIASHAVVGRLPREAAALLAPIGRFLPRGRKEELDMFALRDAG